MRVAFAQPLDFRVRYFGLFDALDGDVHLREQGVELQMIMPNPVPLS